MFLLYYIFSTVLVGSDLEYIEYIFLFVFSDILFLLVCVPFTAYKYSAVDWPFGSFVCKLIKYCLYVTYYVTAYTLVAIAVLRFLIIVCSRVHSFWRRPFNVSLLMLFIWIAVLLTNIPMWQIHEVKTFGAYSYCGVQSEAIKPLFLTYFITGYVLPLILITTFYLFIVAYLCRRTPVGSSSAMAMRKTSVGKTNNNAPLVGPVEPSGAKRRNRKRQRVCRVLVVVVVTFALSWLPVQANILVALFSRVPQGTVYEVLRVLWQCMAYGNSCANPIIYAYASREFRKHFHRMFCKQSARPSSSTTGATVAATRTVNDAQTRPLTTATAASPTKQAEETYL